MPTRLCLAVTQNDLQLVRGLLAESHEDPRAYDSLALRCAAHQGFERVLQALLTDGRADPTACDNDALRYAARYHYYAPVVRTLVADGRSDPSGIARVGCSMYNWPLVQAAARWLRRRQWLRAGMGAWGM
jgi:hypothetical protein